MTPTILEAVADPHLLGSQGDSKRLVEAVACGAGGHLRLADG